MGRGQGDPALRPIVYCIVPRDLAGKVHESLRRHFRDRADVDVIVERRGGDRRAGEERRKDMLRHTEERRRVRNADGRRIDEQRVPVAEVGAPALPRRLARHADRLTFLERLEPSTQHAEDVDTARLVTRFQAGEQDAFSTLYMRYFDRVYTYMHVVLDDAHGAEDATQQIFMKLLETLPRYERRRGYPFRAWLFVVARNHALTERRRRNRYDVVDPGTIPDDAGAFEPQFGNLDWIMDRELMMFINRLPVAQRQVLVLRYVLDLSDTQIADTMQLTPAHVRVLQARALRYLAKRLAAVGRGPTRGVTWIDWRRRCAEAPVIRQRRFALSP